MKMRIFSVLFPTILALIGSPALAGLELVQESTKTIDGTTVTWDSSFRDLDYNLGDTITMVVAWSVDAGAADFDRFELKRFTPRSKKDPAVGLLVGVALLDDSEDGEGRVEVRFRFTGLHLDKYRWVEIGNAHFKLYLNVDVDGDGYPESVAGFGVNVHAEDPQ